MPCRRVFCKVLRNYAYIRTLKPETVKKTAYLSLCMLLLAAGFLLPAGCARLSEASIDADSVVITQGNVRSDFMEIYVDADVAGLEGYSTGIYDKAFKYHAYQEKGYTIIYEVYDPDGELVEKRMQDLGKYGDGQAFSRQELTIPHPQWWTEDNPVHYTLVLRLMIIGRTLSSFSKSFRLGN